MVLEISSAVELQEVAKKIVTTFGSKKVVLFYGEMGVGKTTLIKELCKFLGVKEVTNSPTFSIVNEYLTKEGGVIYHFDFYRINKEEEVLDIGYEDYFYSKNYCFVEWPEKIPNLLPDNTVKIHIELKENNNRLISVVQ